MLVGTPAVDEPTGSKKKERKEIRKKNPDEESPYSKWYQQINMKCTKSIEDHYLDYPTIKGSGLLALKRKPDILLSLC